MANSHVRKMKPHETAAVEETTPYQEAQTDCDRTAKIAEMAYYKAEQRGFEPGHEDADWYEAEKEFDLMQVEHPDG